MKGKEQKFEIRYVKTFGEIGAGTVVPFTPRNEVIPIVVPVGFPDDDQLGTLVVRGISLSDLEIYDGDILLLRRDITNKDITPDAVCAVFIRSTGELVAKRVLYGNKGEFVTLRSSGGDIPDAHYPADDIEVRGVVFGFQRMRNEYGKFNRRPSPDDLPF